MLSKYSEWSQHEEGLVLWLPGQLSAGSFLFKVEELDNLTLTLTTLTHTQDSAQANAKIVYTLTKKPSNVYVLFFITFIHPYLCKLRGIENCVSSFCLLYLEAII